MIGKKMPLGYFEVLLLVYYRSVYYYWFYVSRCPFNILYCYISNTKNNTVYEGIITLEEFLSL